MDLEDLRAAVGAFRRCVLETVGRHDEFIASDLGNTALVLLAIPRRMSTTPSRRSAPGSNCAGRQYLGRRHRPMRCRVGIATGVVIIGDLSGRDDGMTARLSVTRRASPGACNCRRNRTRWQSSRPPGS